MTTDFFAITKRYGWRFRSPGASAHDFFSRRQEELYGELELEKNLLKSLPEPWSLKDIEKSVSRIIDAMENGERITIFGDYDVDGTTSCAMLRRFFEELGYPVHIYIPERLVEGYGLNPIGLGKIKEQGGGLVITVDNGISAVGACDAAREMGIDVIITDHHDVPQVLPRAFAILNPKQPGCNYPFKMLAGVGVAFYLMIALRAVLREKHPEKVQAINLRNYLDLVAIGTIADVAPLNGVNHILCRVGLDVLNEHVRTGFRPGLARLLTLAGWKGDSPVDSSDVGFKIGPRLNAAGRLGAALATEEVLSTRDPKRAAELAEFLHGENADRQFIEKQIKEEAFAMIEGLGGAVPPAIVVHNPEWHTGVVGIVASRILEKYYRPTLVLGTFNGHIKGSGRSTHAFDLFGALNKVRNEFVSFGGHFHAVGVTVTSEKLEWLRRYLCDAVASSIEEHASRRPLEIEGAIQVSTLNSQFLQKMCLFEPFGAHNPRPKWLLRDVQFCSLKRIGKDPSSNHAQIAIEDGSGTAWITAFGMAAELDVEFTKSPRGDLVVEGKLEFWNGQPRAKLHLVDFLPKSV